MAIFPRKRRQGLIGVPDYKNATKLTAPSAAATTKSYTMEGNGWFSCANTSPKKKWYVRWYIHNKLVGAQRAGGDDHMLVSANFPVAKDDVVKMEMGGKRSGIMSTCTIYFIPVKFVAG